jgi:hypothetical protein
MVRQRVIIGKSDAALPGAAATTQEETDMAIADTRGSRALHAEPRPMSKDERMVIFASSLGTVFEWYDFYLFGVMAAIIAANFFTALDPATRDIFTARLRGRVRGAALRRHRLRPAR